jgi:quinol monooxygenase YgiN
MRPGKIEELRLHPLDLAKETRRENGCIHYQLFQNESDPGDFTFVEGWANDFAINGSLYHHASVRRIFEDCIVTCKGSRHT